MSQPTNSNHELPTPPLESLEAVTILVSSRAVIPDYQNNLTVSPATITISSTTGHILSVLPLILDESHFPPGTPYEDKSPYILIPGLVDTHVHLNEPGRTEWEGFATGTRAAASGGVTTVIDMPLNAIPPTTTAKGLEEKIKAAQSQCWVDVGFYGGIVPGNTDQLLPLVEAGVRGFKGFLIESGTLINTFPPKVEEFPAVSPEDVALAMKTLASTPTTLLFHAEMETPAITATSKGSSMNSREEAKLAKAYDTFLVSRPPTFETTAIREIIKLAPIAPDLRLHIVHLSAHEALPILRSARQKGVNITAETCFHYLALASEDISTGDTRHKCCPPIRSKQNKLKLWEELVREDSVIQTVVSDHSPCTPELKLLPPHLERHASENGTQGATKVESGEDQNTSKGSFFEAWGGVASVGLGLPILWTAIQSLDLLETITITDIVTWCCENTSKQVGLQHKKGALRAGLDADICVFDDEASSVVEESRLLFRNKVTPYEGKTLKGVVKETYLRGQKIFASESGGIDESQVPMGKLLLDKLVADKEEKS
ncbi:hypothetical protein G7Y89_g4070 [Cudoniella acicularis]|uniref:allantoinase n=1 Tax=Cudoniella acicularis TaxID=354080 RepID=A0A8H4RRE5_9HELO|nr:hypothetical protein G7Y89_g4070 [Cudoniella acicularis]